jgi:hypothetical protein
VLFLVGAVFLDRGDERGLARAARAAVRSCRAGLPVRLLERTVSRLRAATILSRKISLVSASGVASQTVPVHAPCAPAAIIAAICAPVTIPPAASTGV